MKRLINFNSFTQTLNFLRVQPTLMGVLWFLTKHVELQKLQNVYLIN